MMNLFNANKAIEEKLVKEDFTIVKNKFEQSDEIQGEVIGFWKDAFIRLKQNKAAIVSAWILIFLIFMAFVGPFFTKSTGVAPINSNTQEMMRRYNLPPRIPLIEKLGIPGFFDGTDIRTTYNLDKGEIKEYIDKGYCKLDGTKKDNLGVTSYLVRCDEYKINDLNHSYYWFGTDYNARSYYDRVWEGARLSLTISILAASLNLFIGTVYGAIAGYFGGTWIDNLLMRFSEIIGGIPNLVVLLILLSIFKPGVFTIAISLTATGWIGAARLVRSQFLKIRSQEFVLASITLGANTRRIIFKHLMPNIVGQIVVLLTFMIPSAIYYEAAISFLGLGLQIPQPSIGMLVGESRDKIFSEPYYLLLPLFVIMLLMISVNLLANGLRDSLDPKMRGNS